MDPAARKLPASGSALRKAWSVEQRNELCSCVIPGAQCPAIDMLVRHGLCSSIACIITSLWCCNARGS